MLYVRGKRVEFTFHAWKRMRERDITHERIIQVIEKPDTERRARSSGCRRAERRLGIRTFGVVYREEPTTIRIVTVW